MSEPVIHEGSTLQENEKIVSFVPNILLSELRLAVSAQSADDIKSYTFRGAALLADISGFSKFAGTMCSRGVRGLNDLREVTNGFLGHFVTVVYQYGGDVIAFAGDALICVFVNDPYGFKNAPIKQITSSGRTRLLSSVSEENDGGVPIKTTLSSESGEGSLKSPSTDSFLDDVRDASDPYWNVDCSVRALECAGALRHHTIGNLSTHLGVGFGEMKLALLGGHDDDWVYLLNGECISELSSCITDAHSKEIVCTETCFLEANKIFTTVQFMGSTRSSISAAVNVDADGNPTNVFRIKGLESGNYLVDEIKYTVAPSVRYQRAANLIRNFPAAVIDAAKLFVPRPVLSAIYSDSLDRIAELRQVVTMFLSLDSYSPSLHKDPMTLQPFFFAVQECLHESGGFLRQFLVDDKGCVVIAMWGVPQFSYANNGARGLYCCANIMDKMKSLNLNISIGLTTGYVYCGGIGADIRRDYVVIGDQVNMAARLMCKAHGRLLVDAFTKQTLPQEAQSCLQLAETMKVKGAEAPISPYSYQGPDQNWYNNSDEGPSSTTVLRRQVRVLLSKQLAKVANSTSVAVSRAMTSGMMSMRNISDTTHIVGRSHDENSQRLAEELWGNHAIFTVVLGMSGTGKSTAATYFEQGAKIRQLSCMKFVCRPGDESRPYHLVTKMFIDLVGSDNFETPEGQKAIIKNIVKKTFPFADKKDIRKFELIIENILGVEWSEAYYDSNFEIDKLKLDGEGDDEGNEADDVEAKQPDSNGRSGDYLVTAMVGDNSVSDSISSINSIVATEAEGNSNHLTNNVNSSSSSNLMRPSSSSSSLALASAAVGSRTVGGNASRRPSFALGNAGGHPADGSRGEAKAEVRRRVLVKPGDLTFYEVLRNLLQKRRTVLIVEDAHFCDELSWRELNTILQREDLRIAVLLTLRPPSRQKVKDGMNATGGMAGSVSSKNNPGPSSFLSFFGKKDKDKDKEGKSRENSSSSIHIPAFENLDQIQSSKSFSVAGGDDFVSEFGGDNGAADAVALKFGYKFRPDTALISILSHEHTTVLEMTPLTEDEVREILSQALKTPDLDSDLVLSVLEITAGNAFWCKAIARFIRDTGLDEYRKAIVRHGGKHNSLKALILNRFDRLKTEEQIVVRHAAIVGDEFSLSGLNAILPTRIQPFLIDCLESLQLQGLVCVVEDHLPDVIFAFQNQLIRNTIYDLTPPSDASKMHLAIAEYYERNYKENLRIHYPTLSYHYRNSQGRRALALKYTVKSADQAIARGAFSDGLSYLQMARPLAVSKAELGVLLDVVNAALKDLQPTGLAEKMRRVGVSLQQVKTADNQSKHQQGFTRLKLELTKTIESYNRGESRQTNKNMFDMSNLNDASKNSVYFHNIGRSGSTFSIRNRQTSTKLTWQPSYVSKKKQKESEKTRCMIC